ncbi:unnamed protein product [Amoebophrya sp. A25]|nr:unnamed protein product [Amoebophrya sp. A25]|eukprot:GSA25T00012765001.1
MKVPETRFFRYLLLLKGLLCCFFPCFVDASKTRFVHPINPWVKRDAVKLFPDHESGRALVVRVFLQGRRVTGMNVFVCPTRSVDVDGSDEQREEASVYEFFNVQEPACANPEEEPLMSVTQGTNLKEALKKFIDCDSKLTSDGLATSLSIAAGRRGSRWSGLSQQDVATRAEKTAQSVQRHRLGWLRRQFARAENDKHKGSLQHAFVTCQRCDNHASSTGSIRVEPLLYFLQEECFINGFYREMEAPGSPGGLFFHVDDRKQERTHLIRFWREFEEKRRKHRVGAFTGDVQRKSYLADLLPGTVEWTQNLQADKDSTLLLEQEDPKTNPEAYTRRRTLKYCGWLTDGEEGGESLSSVLSTGKLLHQVATSNDANFLFDQESTFHSVVVQGKFLAAEEVFNNIGIIPESSSTSSSSSSPAEVLVREEAVKKVLAAVADDGELSKILKDPGIKVVHEIIALGSGLEKPDQHRLLLKDLLPGVQTRLVKDYNTELVVHLPTTKHLSTENDFESVRQYVAEKLNLEMGTGGKSASSSRSPQISYFRIMPDPKRLPWACELYKKLFEEDGFRPVIVSTTLTHAIPPPFEYTVKTRAGEAGPLAGGGASPLWNQVGDETGDAEDTKVVLDDSALKKVLQDYTSMDEEHDKTSMEQVEQQVQGSPSTYTTLEDWTFDYPRPAFLPFGFTGTAYTPQKTAEELKTAMLSRLLPCSVSYFLRQVLPGTRRGKWVDSSLGAKAKDQKDFVMFVYTGQSGLFLRRDVVERYQEKRRTSSAAIARYQDERRTSTGAFKKEEEQEPQTPLTTLPPLPQTLDEFQCYLESGIRSDGIVFSLRKIREWLFSGTSEVDMDEASLGSLLRGNLTQALDYLSSKNSPHFTPWNSISKLDFCVDGVCFA